MAISQNIVFGVNPVLEKLKDSSQDILELRIAYGSDRAAIHLVRREAEKLGLRVVWAEPESLDRLAGGHRHQGAVAIIQPYRYWTLTDLLQNILAPTASERILILDGLTDPRNFGALLRTAEAVGVRHIVIPKDRSVGVTPVVVKASAGAAHHVQIVKVTNLRRAITMIKKHGYWIAALDPQSPESVYDRKYPSKLAIVIGSEGGGVRPVNLRECDFLAAIPMLGKVASLNVAVAGAVFLYELLRQARYSGHGLAKDSMHIVG
jgi:23S rRNA (guanosine2251-2'-O)-methyltransferase